jgi:hypothetical protein
MAWPIRNNTGIPDAAYSWSYANMENWQIEHPKQHQTHLMSPSPDPSTTARTSTLSPYNYRLQAPSTPTPPKNMMSPTLSNYLDPNTINRSIHNPSSRSVPAQTTAPVFSPASLCDVGPHSPWSDMAISPAIEESAQLDASEGSSLTKLPCRRRRSRKKYVLFPSVIMSSCPHVNRRVLATLAIVITINTELTSANGRAVNMTGCSRARES